MSLPVTAIINTNNKPKPINSTIASCSSEIGLPRTNSIKFNKSLPPSKPGIGIKLTIPKLIEIIAKKANTYVKPICETCEV